MTVVEPSDNKDFNLWVPDLSLADYVLITKFPDGRKYYYKTDGNVQELLMEDNSDGSEYEGINVTGGSYVLLFNKEEFIMCTKRKDYEELVKIVSETILS